jgi:hypothetical protein
LKELLRIAENLLFNNTKYNIFKNWAYDCCFYALMH